MRNIDRIANLILEDPLITATRIARRLGYAEEKSVYYWLHKSHYTGLKAFKKAVLHGQFMPHTAASEEPSSLYGRLPIADQWTDEGEPIFEGETLAVPSGAPAELIWRYPGPPLMSILPRDLLVLTPIDAAVKSPWLVVYDGQHMELRTMSVHAGHMVIIHPLTLERDNRCQPRYQILQLIRHY